jgi:hypothetical protein
MLRRIAPALGLFFLSPFVAEFLLGNISIAALPVGLVLSPMYGGGALLIREAARRAGRGWATILLLALAYGVIEEGLVTQTLFNPSYFGLDLLRETHVPAFGIGVWWTLFVLTLHTVWSISVPIAIVESFVRDRTQPWLGVPGLVITAVLFVLGSALICSGTYRQEGFIATIPQLLGVVASIVVLIAIAFVVGQPRSRNERAAPQPWRVGAIAFRAASSFMGARNLLADWPIVAAYLLIFGLVAVLVVRWSGRIGWGPAHRLALAGGALLTYAWHSFPEKPVIGSNGTIDLVGNAVFSLSAVVLLAAASRAVGRQQT